MNWFEKTFEIAHDSHKPILSMEGIRGLAVFLVFMVHYVTLIEPWLVVDSTTFQMARSLRAMGNMGVDLFFVLSGYLIYGMLIKKKRPYFSYMGRRIQRIYPAFSFVLLLYLLLSFTIPSTSKIPQGWSGVLYVVQNFFLLPGMFDIPAIVSVAWSLSYEFFYYITMPLVIMVLNLRAWGSMARLRLFIAVSVLGFAGVAVYGGHVSLLMLIAGVVLFELAEFQRPRIMQGIGLAALVAAIALTTLLYPVKIMGWWKYAAMYVLFLLFCMECFTVNGLAARIFSHAPIRWLGNMSYSYYLIHGLALKLLFVLLAYVSPSSQNTNLLFWALLPIFFVLTLIPGVLLFVAIERPYSLMVQVGPRSDTRHTNAG